MAARKARISSPFGTNPIANTTSSDPSRPPHARWPTALSKPLVGNIPTTWTPTISGWAPWTGILLIAISSPSTWPRRSANRPRRKPSALSWASTRNSSARSTFRGLTNLSDRARRGGAHCRQFPARRAGGGKDLSSHRPAKGRDASSPRFRWTKPTPQTPAELLMILAAMAGRGVPVQTIAPKFTGRFNKGVDYVGDLLSSKRNSTRTWPSFGSRSSAMAFRTISN